MIKTFNYSGGAKYILEFELYVKVAKRLFVRNRPPDELLAHYSQYW